MKVNVRCLLINNKRNGNRTREKRAASPAARHVVAAKAATGGGGGGGRSLYMVGRGDRRNEIDKGESWQTQILIILLTKPKRILQELEIVQPF